MVIWISRRAFLKAAGITAATVAGGGLAGCGALGTTPPLAQLAGRLTGVLISPDNQDFERSSLLFNTYFDLIAPAAIAYCANEDDVARCIQWSRENSIAFRVRSGGHCYAGYSTIAAGLVIDVSRMKKIALDRDTKTVSVGPGVHNIDVYSALAPVGLTVPSGSCPTVGISGITLGGGIGLIGRQFGTLSDHLTQINTVTATGSLIRASRNDQPDLLWASQGGGGGNFGVATDLSFSTVAAQSSEWFVYSWPFERAAPLMAAWMAALETWPRELTTILKIQTTGSTAANAGSPGVVLAGRFVGRRSALAKLLAPILKAAGKPATYTPGAGSYMKSVQFWAGCQGESVTQCHRHDIVRGGKTKRVPYAATSWYFDKPMDAKGIQVCIDAVAARAADDRYGDGVLQFDDLGAAYNEVEPTATAYVHRAATYHLQPQSYWAQGEDISTIKFNREWIRDVTAALRPWSNQQAYVNYIDPDLDGWLQAYYAQNLGRLQQIKKQWGPDNVFNFKQSIPLGVPLNGLSGTDK